MDRGAIIISILAEAQVKQRRPFTTKASNTAFKTRPTALGSLYSDFHHPHAVPGMIWR